MILHHNTYVTLPGNAPWLTKAFSALWVRVGWMGVDLFFVLSGFLISGLLYGEHKKYGSIDLKRFFIRRGLKIYPPFYAMLAVTLVTAVLVDIGRSTNLSRVLPELFFVQNYFDPVWGHTWSLAVEEHFYILLGLSIYLILRRSGGEKDPFAVLPKAFLVIALAVLAMRIWKSPYTYGKTHFRLDSLLFGVILSYYYNYHHDGFVSIIRRLRRPVLWGGLCLVSIVCISGRGGITPTIGFSLLYIGFGALLMLSVIFPVPETGSVGAAVRVLAGIGAYSYSIYLWHCAVGQWTPIFKRLVLGGGLNWYAFMAFYVPASVLVGIGMAKLVEYPFLRLRDRWYPSRSRALDSRESGDSVPDGATASRAS